MGNDQFQDDILTAAAGVILHCVFVGQWVISYWTADLPSGGGYCRAPGYHY